MMLKEYGSKYRQEYKTNHPVLDLPLQEEAPSYMVWLEARLAQLEAELAKWRTKYSKNMCAECTLYGLECECDDTLNGGG